MVHFKKLQFQSRCGLAVIAEKFQRRAGAVAEDLEGPIQRILTEGAPTERRQPIPAFTEIDRGQGHKNPTLRGQLQQDTPSRKACRMTARGGAA